MNDKNKVTKYKCAECGILALVIEIEKENVVVRPCNHNTAGVIAELSAVAHGESYFLNLVK